jgi:aerobic carbon-monoxide dehydrogenase small subunit
VNALSDPDAPVTIELRVNEAAVAVSVPARHLLSDVLRDELGLTGLRLGCEQGVCGGCIVLLDGEPVCSCLMLAVEAAGCSVQTVEHLSNHGDRLGLLEEAFLARGAVQCGFCTAGFLVMGHHLLATGEAADPEAVRWRLSGNLCRCTGYEAIVDAIVATGREHETVEHC